MLPLYSGKYDVIDYGLTAYEFVGDKRISFRSFSFDILLCE